MVLLLMVVHLWIAMLLMMLLVVMVTIRVNSILSIRMNFHISRVLVSGSWFVGLDNGSESMTVRDIVDLSVNTTLISEAIASLDVAMTISMLVSVLFTMMVFHLVSKFIRLGMIVL
ncbi:hypothetical protein CDAR_407021 [Caerostris darwini]|uniref:NADH dehydrogenase subunit 6 n=1 Tax=Caerostris darwini TaxID=1538125 RepID=A0AAV4RAQ1_9ARAC|nr:hypothetical protein CDAR_407021 [Caerostris darwini]